MDGNFRNDIESLARNIRAFAKILEVDTFFSFIEVADLIRKYTAIYTARKPASTSGHNVLNVLVLNGGKMTATEISKQVFRSRHTVTRLVDTLEGKGLVKRKTLGKDRRMKSVSITRKGLELVEQASSHMQKEVINVAFRPLSQGKLEELNTMLKMLKTHLASLVITSDKDGLDMEEE